MKKSRLSPGFVLAFVVIAFPLLAQSQTYKYSTIYNFQNNGTDPTFPVASLILDAAGNIYGTSSTGGNLDLGTAFKISRAQKLTVLHSFQGMPDGQTPLAGLVRDAAGNLYGTTSGGGNDSGKTLCASDTLNGCGTVFKLTPSGKETILYRFNGGNDGTSPSSRLALDSAGNLYGAAPDQLTVTGAAGYGTVFRIDAHGVFSTLYDFCPGGTTTGVCAAGYLGRVDYNGVTLDGGNLYGGAAADGNKDDGAVIYEITPGGTETVLHTFSGGAEGEGPGDLTPDAHGNLYGVTSEGTENAGTLFKITKAGVKTLLYTFCSLANCIDGSYPSNVVIDKDGNVFGFVSQGGANGCGGLFKYDTSGKETVPFSFSCDGVSLTTSPAMDSSGNFYGGFLISNFGGVFKLTLVK